MSRQELCSSSLRSSISSVPMVSTRSGHYGLPLPRRPHSQRLCGFGLNRRWRKAHKLVRHPGSTCRKGFFTNANLQKKIHGMEGRKADSSQTRKQKVDAVTRAHGEPLTQLPADWESLMNKFKWKFGMDIPEFHMPGRSYCEAFEEKLNEGRLKPETLAEVISVEGGDGANRCQRGPKHSLSTHSMTVATRRWYPSSMPRNTEELRATYQVMSNMWLLSQMRQPGRHLFIDFDDTTWPKLHEELVNRKNLNFQRQLQNKVFREKKVSVSPQRSGRHTATPSTEWSTGLRSCQSQTPNQRKKGRANPTTRTRSLHDWEQRTRS